MVPVPILPGKICPYVFSDFWPWVFAIFNALELGSVPYRDIFFPRKGDCDVVYQLGWNNLRISRSVGVRINRDFLGKLQLCSKKSLLAAAAGKLERFRVTALVDRLVVCGIAIEAQSYRDSVLTEAVCISSLSLPFKGRFITAGRLRRSSLQKSSYPSP